MHGLKRWSSNVKRLFSDYTPRASGFDPPSGFGLRPPLGLRASAPPRDSGFGPPSGFGLRPPSGFGLRPPSGFGLRPPLGLRASAPPRASGFGPPSGFGLRPPPRASGFGLPLGLRASAEARRPAAFRQPGGTPTLLPSLTQDMHLRKLAHVSIQSRHEPSATGTLSPTTARSTTSSRTSQRRLKSCRPPTAATRARVTTQGSAPLLSGQRPSASQEARRPYFFPSSQKTRTLRKFAHVSSSEPTRRSQMGGHDP